MLVELDFVTVFVFTVGTIAVTSSVLDLDWFFEHPKTFLVVKLIGRPAARVLYFLLGLFLIFGKLFVMLAKAFLLADPAQ